MEPMMKLIKADDIRASEAVGSLPLPKAPSVIEEAFSKLDELGTLKDGWDSYRGQAPSRQTLYAAASLINGIFDDFTPMPGIFPVPNGNIQIEWSRDNKEIEIEVKSLNEFQLYFHHITTGEEYEKTLGYDFEELREIIIQLGESNRPRLHVVNS